MQVLLLNVRSLRHTSERAAGVTVSQTQEELDALLPSVLDRAFKGEL